MTLSSFDAARRGALTQKLLGQLDKKPRVEVKERWKALSERSKAEEPSVILAEAGKLVFVEPKVVTIRGDDREYLCAFDAGSWMEPERNSLFWHAKKGYFANTVYNLVHYEVGEAWQHWADFIYWDNTVSLWRREGISWLTEDFTPVKDEQILAQAKELLEEKESEYDLSEFRELISRVRVALGAVKEDAEHLEFARRDGVYVEADGTRVDPDTATEVLYSSKHDLENARDRLVRYARDRLERGRGYFSSLVDIDAPWENANVALYRESGLEESEFELVSNGGLEDLAKALNRPRSEP